MKDNNFWINETVALLTFSLMKGIGYWTIRNIALSGLSFKEVLKEAESQNGLVKLLRSYQCKNISQLTETLLNTNIDVLWSEANKIYMSLMNQNIQVIHFEQEIFPVRLREIKDPPKWLFVQGNQSILNRPAITIVGTRTPSEDGKFLAQYVGACLASFPDCVTVSGLANGIDQTIHRQSIRFQKPTIAFLGNGILLDYPRNSNELRQEICDNGGAIVSEYLPSESYNAANFVHRNRLQAGLGNLLLPVEWKPNSGTAHTVRFAYEANRQIICLKLPDWSNSRPELKLARDINAKIFTIPGEESSFLEMINFIINNRINCEKQTLTNSSRKFFQKINDDYNQLNLFIDNNE